MPVDPVCGMQASNGDEITAKYEGTTYYFCSTDCQDFFEEHPKRFLDEPHPHLSEASSVPIPRLPYGRAGGEFDLFIAEPGSLHVDDRVEFRKTLTDDDVLMFAEATGDTNALHLSDSFAEGTRFGGRIVHGTLVSGLISAALACFPGLTIYLSQNLEFRRPVDIGDTLTAQCKIVNELEDDRYRLTTRIENDTDEIVLDGTATVLIDPLPE
ncbi:MaoC/PaaZ C-terminal domain-containing protein [Natrinema sp. 1APR25-10V2]|uniref:MaoC/PaaZ C-terminal domain-containing protein n=1 Tax=Natrinema sp. 1APR25-10V2 TaxID=2951081 RepID=UPI0028764660|nr:MaoC/PaaZ C-terminal domain-containing protein [Natrinema sp. 1APR25-10V2]MDS0474628.1 YHS domain-containing protein [Natrinema sp. 1APR25-10V2]